MSTVLSSRKNIVVLLSLLTLLLCTVFIGEAAPPVPGVHPPRPKAYTPRHEPVPAPKMPQGTSHAQAGVSVKDFGAVGDGVTDDTEALNAAFSKGGRIVLEPKRKYHVGRRLYITKSGTEIDMNGSSIISDRGLLMNATPDSTARKYSGVSDIFIHDGELRGMAMGLIHGSNITLRRVSFINSNGSHSIQISACNRVTIAECRFKGLNKKNASENTHYEHINIDPCDYTAFPYLTKGSPTYDGTKNRDITIDGCTFTRGQGEYNHFDTAIGVHHDDGAGNLHDSVRVVNCRIEGVSKWGVRLNVCQNSIVENCTISTQLYALNTGHTNTRSKNITFRNNTIRMLDKKNVQPFHIGPFRTENLSVYGNTFNNEIGQTEPLFRVIALADKGREMTLHRIQRTPLASKISGPKIKSVLPLTQLNKLYLEIGGLGKSNLITVSSPKKFRVGEKFSVLSITPKFAGIVYIADEYTLMMHGLSSGVRMVYGALEQ